MNDQSFEETTARICEKDWLRVDTESIEKANMATSATAPMVIVKRNFPRKENEFMAMLLVLGVEKIGSF